MPITFDYTIYFVGLNNDIEPLKDRSIKNGKNVQQNSISNNLLLRKSTYLTGELE